MNLNKAFLIGRLTQDPQLKTVPSGRSVCTIGLATNRIGKNPKTGELIKSTEYHNVVLWQRLAEIASQYLKKGSLVFIEGRIQTRNWQDASGNKRTKTEIVAERIQLAPKASQPISEEQPPQEEEIPIIEDKEEEIDIEEIPF